MMGEQGDNDRLDESMGERNGPAMQGMQARRDESKGMESSSGKNSSTLVIKPCLV
jgi:hypothetical protein